jgi:hypothetical protein
MPPGTGVEISFDRDSLSASGPTTVSASAGARLRNFRAAMTFWVMIGLFFAANVLVRVWTALRHR